MMYSIGIDIADKTFTCSCVTPDFDAVKGVVAYRSIWFGHTYDQTDDGWNALLALLDEHGITQDACKFVMEATGVYSERISFFLYQRGYAVYVEPPHKVHTAFYEKGKTDPVDSRQIAEYGFRFADKMHAWQPRDVMIDLISSLLTTREQLVKMRTACKNTLRGFQRKQRLYPELIETYSTLADDLHTRIAGVEQAIKQQIATNPYVEQTTTHLQTIPSVGFQVSVNFLVITEGYTQHLRYQNLASYIGVCPWEFRSGTSVYRRPQADGAGPVRLRKQLYLAAMRLRRTHPEYKKYFERKVAEGKTPRMVLTNIENKLLRLMCGVVKSGKPYIKDYVSLKPEKS